MDNSFALIPELERESRIEQNLHERNIFPLPLTFEELIAELSKVEDRITSVEKHEKNLLRLNSGNIWIQYRDYKEFEEFFRILSEWELQRAVEGESEPERIKAFLKGRSTGWEPFEKEWDFKREIYFDLKDRIVQEMDESKRRPEDNKALLLKGGGGLGKSILLKRIAYDFYKSGMPVIILNSYLSSFDHQMINHFCEVVNPEISGIESPVKNKVLIILDDAAANIEHMKKIKDYLKNHSKPALILGAARPNEWAIAEERCQYRGMISESDIFETSQKMRGGEINQLLHKNTGPTQHHIRVH